MGMEKMVKKEEKIKRIKENIGGKSVMWHRRKQCNGKTRKENI